MAEETKTETVETTENSGDQPSIIESVVNTVSSAVSSVVETATSVFEGAAQAVVGTNTSDDKASEKVRKRAQKIGVVSSDKMTKTVVVKVDRQIMHPKYRRYIRRTTKFMAHDEMGAGIGDKVRIEESRPLSARKRWRVVEVIQKAAR